MKKITTLFLLLALLLTPVFGVAEAEMAEDMTIEEINALDLEATTVIKSSDSVTGYYVSFRYYDPEASRVRLSGQEFNYSDLSHTTPYSYLDATPYDWQDGYFVVGATTGNNMFDMEKNEETGWWYITMPMPNGAFNYWFIVGGEDGVSDASGSNVTIEGALQTWDPTNVPFRPDYDPALMVGNAARSTLYVPLDPEKQTQFTNLSQAPREDGKTGEYFYVTLDTEYGEDTFCVYLPYGFDAEREEPYRMVAVYHGSGGDEGCWINQGVVNNIADNAIADDGIEPFVMVMPSYTRYRVDDRTSYEVFEIASDILQNTILPYMQENYNVSSDPDDLALTGLSMGGMFTQHVALKTPESFGYYFVQNGRYDEAAAAEYDLTQEALKDIRLVLGTGIYDDPTGFLQTAQAFAENGIEHETFLFPSSHKWFYWRNAFNYGLHEFFWQ